MEAIVGVLAGSVVLAITGAMVWLGVKALGTPADRAAAGRRHHAGSVSPPEPLDVRTA